jgi:hypothetical protein
MPTIGGGNDFVWIGGPDEGLWLLVVVGDEAIDGGLEIVGRIVDPPLHLSPCRNYGSSNVSIIRDSNMADHDPPYGPASCPPYELLRTAGR